MCKSLFKTFILVLPLCLITSCGEKKDNNNDDVWVAPVKSDTIAYSSKQDVKDTLQINNEVYEYKLHREPSDSMPLVTSFSEQKYKDNEVDLSISSKKDGTIFKKHFNKKIWSCCFMQLNG